MRELSCAGRFPACFRGVRWSSNYASPPGASNPWWDVGDWANSYIFRDEVGQCCNGQNPAVELTSASPPYTYNTVYLDGSHYLFAGTLTAGDGWNIFMGTIQYFRDHGGNTP